MDPVARVRDFLIANVGHMTDAGRATFDSVNRRWFVPIYCQTDRGAIVVGDVELDEGGHIISAPSREQMLERLDKATPASSVSA